jgi:putative Ca2+/H+ antiporter (TMEM165/GDT1 family)/protein-S-isoprenylcysteine O-methyltransferase Ste14
VTGWLATLVLSFAVIFVAELGDKSQLMALAFAGRYPTRSVLIGITLATTVVHAVSVAVGHGLGVAIPTGWATLGAGVAFLVFAAWTARGDSLTDGEFGRVGRYTAGSAVLAASIAFFLAELGDKTMLATVTLAAQHDWAGVWVGSTLGMVVADALAILVGRALGQRLPERTVRFGATGLFVLFGAWLLNDAAGELTGTPPWAALAAALDHHTAGWAALALGVGSILAVSLARGHRRSPTRGRVSSGAARWARRLMVTAGTVGMVTPLLVAADVLQPIALLSEPGVVVIGAGLLLLGVSVLLLTQREVGRAGAGPDGCTPPITEGIFARVRHPGSTGTVLAMAGTLLMVPTVLEVLACVLLVVAVQIEVRRVREPGLADLLGPDYAGYAGRTGLFLPRIGAGAR